jgi:hypothetical protein|tara:strand:- start:81 stop:317 length:237 start_codon:yes stop_codon:yes gene_type:complete
MKNKQPKEKKMKTVKEDTGGTSFINIIGGLLIAFAVIDFAMSFAGTNLTSFMGPVSRFSPIIFGLIGSTLLNVGKEGS